MKSSTILILLLIIVNVSMAQEIIKLPYSDIEGIQWENAEKSFHSSDWDNEVVTNVSVPTMQVFKPEKPNGTSVIVAPGGGLYALSIMSEGTMVGEWLAQNGITAFVLKYRLVPTGEDGVKDLANDGAKDPKLVEKKVSEVLPYSVQDALAAISFVRINAGDYSVDPDKIGLMGFSAGGAVVMEAAYNCKVENAPNFIVPIYAWTRVFDVQEAPSDAPPIFVICSSDDPLGLAPGSIEIYNAWLKAGKSSAMHMYAKGGHGYGMKKQGLPSDDWIKRVYEWMLSEKLSK